MCHLRSKQRASSRYSETHRVKGTRQLFIAVLRQPCRKRDVKSASGTTTPTDGNQWAFNMAACGGRRSVKQCERKAESRVQPGRPQGWGNGSWGSCLGWVSGGGEGRSNISYPPPRHNTTPARRPLSRGRARQGMSPRCCSTRLSINISSLN